MTYSGRHILVRYDTCPLRSLVLDPPCIWLLSRRNGYSLRRLLLQIDQGKEGILLSQENTREDVS